MMPTHEQQIKVYILSETVLALTLRPMSHLEVFHTFRKDNAVRNWI